MKEFIKLDKYGQLYIDRILFESYFPIIFTCVNDNGDIFISICCQSNEKGCKWLLGKTDETSIIKMLQDEITIRELLLEHSSGKISIDYIENEYTVDYDNSDWVADSPYLPKKDSYMCAEDGEFDDEINYFSSLNALPYDIKYYKSIEEANGTSILGKFMINTERYKLAYNDIYITVSEGLNIKIESKNNNHYADAA